jgi:hypothetical protein
VTADTDPRLAEALGALEGLLAEIAPLRQRVAEVRAGLAQAVRDYARALREVNDEAARLAARQAFLRAQLAWVPHAAPPAAHPESASALASAPDPKPDAPPSAGPLSARPTADPRADRKSAFADHVFFFASFADAGEEDAVRQRINAVLNDPATDLGDVLEVLAWGPVWKARQEWETPDQQLDRLATWQAALAERLAHWRRELAGLDGSDQRDLYEERRARTPEGWRTYLAELADEQRAENARLTRAVATLEAQWAARQAAFGGAGA